MTHQTGMIDHTNWYIFHLIIAKWKQLYFDKFHCKYMEFHIKQTRDNHALFTGNPLDSSHKGPVMLTLDVLFDVSQNRLLNKQIASYLRHSESHVTLFDASPYQCPTCMKPRLGHHCARRCPRRPECAWHSVVVDNSKIDVNAYLKLTLAISDTKWPLKCHTIWNVST